MAVQETVLISFEVDYDQLTNAQTELAKSGKVDKKGFDEIQKAIDTTAKDSKGLIVAFKNVAQASVKMGKTVEDAFGAGVQDALDNAGVSVKEFETALKKTNAPAITLKKELRDLKEALARMKAEGKDTGAEFDAMRAKAGKLSDAISDANAEIKNAGSDTRGIDNVVGSISALAGGYAAVQGAAALFGEENEDLQKALLKVNGAMALASGLQQTLNALQKEGALTKLADSVATGAQTAAQRVYAFAVGTSTGAMKAFRIALLATGIGAIVYVLYQAATAMGLFGDETDGSTVSIEDFNKVLDAQNRLLDDNISKIETAGKVSAERLKQQGKDGLAIALNDLKTQNLVLDKLKEQELQSAKDRNRNRLKIGDIDFKLSQKIGQREASRLQSEKDNLLKIDEAFGEQRLKLTQQIRDKQNEIEIGNVQAIGIAESIEKAKLQKQIEFDKRRLEAREKALKEAAELDKKNATDYFQRVLDGFNKEEEALRIHFENEQEIIDRDKQQRLADEAAWDAQRLAQMKSFTESSQVEIDKRNEADKAATDLRIANAQRYLALAQQTASLLGQIASIQTERDQQEIDSQRKVVEEKLKAGAITEKAALQEQERIDKQEKKFRYQAAVREKKAASFQAVLAIPQAFLQGLTSAPPPYGAILGAIAAALAAAQAAIIISKPVPKFFRGKKDSYKGPGIVGDMGTELVERNGRMFLYTKPTQTYLGANDKVYTAAETRQIMHNTNISTTVKQQPAAGFDYDRLGKAIPASLININIDKDFISESVIGALSRKNYMDRRYSSK